MRTGAGWLGSCGMTWIVPVPERSDPPYAADERRRLDSWLDFHRATLLSKCARAGRYS
jgi:hypothetical protein